MAIYRNFILLLARINTIDSNISCSAECRILYKFLLMK